MTVLLDLFANDLLQRSLLSGLSLENSAKDQEETDKAKQQG